MNTLLFFKALADETRLRIVNLLRVRELNVNEIVYILQMGQSRISRHLKILTDAGILSPRREGLWIFYSLARTPDIRSFFENNLFFMEQVPFIQEDRENLKILREQKLKEDALFFNSLAGSWSKMKEEIYGDFNPDQLLIDRLPRASVIADLGCGTGEFLSKLLDKGDHLIGVDNSSLMLEEARNLSRDQKLDFRLGDIEHLPLRDTEADLVFFNMVLHHFGDIKPVLSEAFRVLKPGGGLYITEFRKHEIEEMRQRYGDARLGFEPRELEEVLSSQGFTMEIKENYPLNRGLEILFYHFSK